MDLKRMKSKFFGTGSKPSSSAPTSSPASSSRSSNGPPPMPAINALHIAPPAQRHIQKPQQRPMPVSYVTNEMIRELRELIRYRYALDCRIWDIGRKVKWFQRDTVEADMRRSDAALSTIKGILNGWDRQEYFATVDEFRRFKEIKDRIMGANTRSWAKHPPWEKQDVHADSGVYEKDGQPIHYVHRVSMPRPFPSESSSASRY